MLRTLPTALALVVVLAASAAGQQPPSPPRAESAAPADARTFAIQRLRPAAVVRVASVPDGRVTGRLRGADSAQLRLEVAGAERIVRLGPDDTLWVRGLATKRGAVAGGITGLALSALVVMATTSCQGGGDDPCTGWIFEPGGRIALVAGTTASFAAVGAILGSAFPRWHRRYPAEK